MKANRMNRSMLKVSKDVINKVIFVLLLGYISWSLIRVGLMVWAANSFF